MKYFVLSFQVFFLRLAKKIKIDLHFEQLRLSRCCTYTLHIPHCRIACDTVFQ